MVRPATLEERIQHERDCLWHDAIQRAGEAQLQAAFEDLRQKIAANPEAFEPQTACLRLREKIDPKAFEPQTHVKIKLANPEALFPDPRTPADVKMKLSLKAKQPPADPPIVILVIL